MRACRVSVSINLIVSSVLFLIFTEVVSVFALFVYVYQHKYNLDHQIRLVYSVST